MIAASAVTRRSTTTIGTSTYQIANARLGPAGKRGAPGEAERQARSHASRGRVERADHDARWHHAQIRRAPSAMRTLKSCRLSATT